MENEVTMSLTPRLDRAEPNKIINGNFDFWQRARVVGSTRTIAALGLVSDRIYTADRWSHSDYFASGSLTISRSVDIPTGLPEATYSLSTAIGAVISVAHASNSYHVNAGVYRMEGYDAADFYGKTVTLQFWVKSSLTGLFSVAFGSNYDSGSAKYVSTYTVNAANTWEQKSITLTIDTTYGSFSKDTTQGLFVAFGIACNATPAANRTTNNLNQWLTGSSALIASTANRTDFLTTIGNTIKLAQVKLSVGSQLTEFSRRGGSVTDEQKLCQRYYEYSEGITSTGDFSVTVTKIPDGTNNRGLLSGGEFKVTKRTTPTVKLYAGSSAGTADVISVYNGVATTLTVNSISGTSTGKIGIWLLTSGAISAATAYIAEWTADAEL